MPEELTTRCLACGSSSSGSARFCRHCGNDLAAPAALPELWREPEQRTEVLADLPLDPPGRGVGEPAEAGAPRRRSVLGVFLVVLGLVLVAAGGYGGYRATVDGPDRPSDGRPGRSAVAGAAPSGADRVPSSRPGGPVVSGPGVSGPGVGGSPTASDGAPPSSALVAVAPALAERPETGPVVRLLAAYFAAVNARDFAGLRATLVDRPGLPQTEAEFLDQFGSTQDSEVRLLGLRQSADGYVASVGFTSWQDPADAPDQASPCVRWSMAYPLVWAGQVLLIDEVRKSDVSYRRC